MNVKPAQAAAFAPGHITGFFEIHDENPDLSRRGSRGAGFSLDKGAITYVEIEPADTMDIRILLNQKEQEAPVTRDAITTLLKLGVRDGRIPINREAPKGQRAQIRVTAHTDLQLPVSQGYGMSAAGALSTSLALAKTLRLGRSEAITAAHHADVNQRAGLGDVAGAVHGGFEIRLAPGIPPYGNITHFIGYGDAVLCTIGTPLETRTILNDSAKRERVNAAGAHALDDLMKEPSMDRFLTISQRFAQDSGLLPDNLAEAIQKCAPHGKASMSMLGNSLYAFGNTAKLTETLQKYGDTQTVPISQQGARLLEIQKKE